jgi:hypothetical protein
MDAVRWLCMRCADRKGLARDPALEMVRKCSSCKVENYCQPVTGAAFHTISVRVPVTVYRELRAKAESVGCSMSSLVKTYIHNGLEGVVYTGSYTQTRSVSQTVQQEVKFTAKANKQPANYAQPAYFAELKKALQKRKARSATQH